MCGTFFFSGKGFTLLQIYEAFLKVQKRGPDNSKFSHCEKDGVITCEGFHRLAINGLSGKADQPMILWDMDHVSLLANAEIYNYKELANKYNIELKTDSDCEIILHLFKIIPPIQIFKELDGEFAIIIFDKVKNRIYYGRDPCGIRPMYQTFDEESKTITLASELMGLVDLQKKKGQIQYVKPGQVYMYTLGEDGYVSYPYYFYKYKTVNMKREEAQSKLRVVLVKAVYKRLMSDVEIGMFLSGGLDSSLATGIVCMLILAKNLGFIKSINDITDEWISTMSKYFFDENGVKKNYRKYVSNLKCFSIGMNGATDIKYTKMAAEHLGIKHYVYEPTKHEFINNLETTIKNIGSYDTTTVRASNGNYIIAKYAKKMGVTVVMTGEGPDEVAGGYMDFKNAKTDKDFDKGCKYRYKELYKFDVLRCDESISRNGLEGRVPYLDTPFVEFYFSIPVEFRNDKRQEKYLIRKSFDELNLLPKEVLWRKKEAFSDGVSSLEEPWFKTIQHFANKKITVQELEIYKQKYKRVKLYTKEQVYFVKIFEKYFPNCEHILDYYWEPMFSDIREASARVLDVYNK